MNTIAATNNATWILRFSRVGAAVVLTGFLIIFLVGTRMIEPKNEVLTLRSISGIDPVSMPAPPPPPPTALSQPTPPPPPPVTMDLPKLDLSVDDMAPPIKAVIAEKQFEFEMAPAEFSSNQPEVKARNLFSSADLDNQPRLLNRPRVNFPSHLKSQRIREGKVTLEVLINTAGRITIRRIVSSSHPDFVPMAKSFAMQSKFSPPKKDGRIVNAVFNWPLVLRP